MSPAIEWILVIAGNSVEHDAFERMYPTGRYVGLNDMRVLDGRRFESIILVGKWWENRVVQTVGWDVLLSRLSYYQHVSKFIEPREPRETEIVIEADLNGLG